MTEPGKAVFLSYASQDAGAAKRICDALRAGGVEVWFDQSELRGGDAWDAKIRRQIRECALFVPVISPNTNARPEGYFRLEWKLAVDRSHLMADDAPFLFPVAVGGVDEVTARVPDRFREVQWTKLRLDETPAELAGRIQRLLTQPAGEAGGLGAPRAQPAARAGRAHPAAGGWMRYAWAGVGLLFGLVYAVRPLLTRDALVPARPAATPAPVPTVSEARQLAFKARALYETVDSTRDDYVAAESLMQRAVQLDPSDGLVWAISSRLNSGFAMRGFDRSAVRLENARSQMERATRLAPNEPEAWLARGSYLRRAAGSRQEAEQALRKAIELDPSDRRPWFDLAWALAGPGNDDEVFALLEKSIDPARPGTGALARYNQFNLRFATRRFAEADALIRQAVAEVPASNFVTGLMRSELFWKGDAAAAVAALQLLTPERRSETRSILFAAQAHLGARQPAEALADLRRLPTDYIADSFFTGPRGYWEGWAHHQLGNHEAARAAWESALAVSRRENPDRTGPTILMQAHLLALLGRKDEAESTLRTFEQAGGPDVARYRVDVSRVYAALGQVDVVLPRLEKHLADPGVVGELVTPAKLRMDPAWDPIRGDPRFQRLAAGGAPPVTREWPKDAELKRALALIEGLEAIPDDFALAEDLAKRLLERSPADVETLTVMARIQGQYLRRGFDRSDERAALARRYAERALQLAPDEPQAMLALATYLFSRAIDPARAERLVRRAMEIEPQDPRHGRLLADVLAAANRPEEALAQGRENVRLHPGDVLSHYDYARLCKDLGRFEEFDRELDATIAVAPLPNAIVWKSRLQFGLHNDLAASKQWLDRVPERVRGTERAVFGYVLYAAFGHDPESGLEALRGFPQKWFSDFEYAGPTALLNAELLKLQGRTEHARQQYEVAWVEIQKMRVTEPDRSGLAGVEFWTLLGLERRDDARSSYRRVIEGLHRPYAQSLVTGWWFTPIPAALLLGDRDTALALLRESVTTRPESRGAFKVRMQLDPRMAPFRDDPEIKALLAEPEAKP